MSEVQARASASTTAGVSVRDVHAEMTAVLERSLGEGAAREARELLALLHDMPRHWVSTAGDTMLDASDARIALHAAMQRAAGTPLQYAAGRAAFRHLMLDVDPRALIPRPETELLVDIVLERVRHEDGGIAVDVGTGTGAIALSLATEGRFDRVIATDISLDALMVASANAARVAPATPLELRHGSLLGPVPERGLRAVVSNPPYIAFSEADALPPSVRDWEPFVALFSSEEGMATTARLVRDAAPALAPRGVLALEVDVRRAATVAEVVGSHGAYEDVQVLLDLTGRERFVVARRLEEDR